MGCLRDLKKLWRKDDTDDERSVARVFARIGAIRDLVDIVEEVSERGSWGYKVGLMASTYRAFVYSDGHQVRCVEVITDASRPQPISSPP